MKIIKNTLKFIIAGLLAIIILCIIFTFYSLLPVHTASPFGNTDYVWPAHSHWIKMSEGISWGRFDKNGFNNISDSGYENTDILILGSSHMEATNVMQSKNTASLLQKKIPNKKVYNMGISGHNIAKVFRYLPETLSLFEKIPETIIVETSSLYFSEDLVNKILTDTVDFTPSNDKGIIAKLQRLPFLRNIYHQFEHGLVDLLFPSRKNVNDTKNIDNIQISNQSQYDILFNYLSDCLSDYDTNLVIFYHPTEQLNIDGSVTYNQDKYIDVFSNHCEETDKITFVDMTKPFLNMYEIEHKLPHGFTTGLIGSGHINSYGHKCIADELYRVITEEL